MQEVRELGEVARLPPWLYSRRVLFIDECHALDRQKWDVLLKVLEEPPRPLVMVFSATDIQAVPRTARSRCQILETRLLGEDTSIALLEQVARRESITCEPPALKILAPVSGGSARSLLTNLEQATLLGDAMLEHVRLLFNLDPILRLPATWRALLGDDGGALTAALAGWEGGLSGLSQAMQEFLLFLLFRHVPDTPATFDPVFTHIPEAEVAEVLTALEARAAAAELPLEQAVLALVGRLATPSSRLEGRSGMAESSDLGEQIQLEDLAGSTHRRSLGVLRGQIPAVGPFQRRFPGWSDPTREHAKPWLSRTLRAACGHSGKADR